MAALRLIQHGNINYFLQIKIPAESTIINLTDLKNIWQIKLAENEAVKKFKVDNPLIQSSDKWIAEYVSTVIKNTNTNIEINISEPYISITFSSNVSSLPTKLNFQLQLQDSETVYKEITLPLLMLINELLFRQEKLLSIVKSKDVEIKEFKFEGATITRRNAITEPFNALNFDNECQTSVEERAKDILKNPCSVICPSLNSLYNELSSVVDNSEFKAEKLENNSIEISQKEIKTNLKESTNNIKINPESEIELKRKISESLSRTKRPKKLYKI